MPEWRVPLSDVRFTAEEIDAVTEVYRGGWLSQGPRVAEFETAFAEFTGSPYAIAVANGTAALHLICIGLGLGPGDEVIVPSLTFVASAAAVVHAGATPVFADIRGPDAPWLSADAAEAAIGERTRAMIAVSYGGHSGELAALRALADARGLALIEDAAHALGAREPGGGRHVGTVGEAGAFSFFANKNMPLGEGGMIVTADRKLADRMRLLRSHGMTSGTWGRHTRAADAYDVIEPGFNYRLDEPRAALGRRLLGRVERDNARRAEIAAQYAGALAGIDPIRPGIDPDGLADGACAWHIFPVVLGEGIDRADFRNRLHRAGVQTSIHYPPLHLTPAFAARDHGPMDATEEYGHRTVTVPLHQHMSDNDVETVLHAVSSATE